MNFESLSTIEAHYAASSLEGCKISTLVDHNEFEAILDCLRSFQICFSNIGSKYAAVFPEPVTALAKISFPANIYGITDLYILVGWSYSRAVHAFTNGFERKSS